MSKSSSSMKSEKPVASAADKVYSIDVPKLEALRESKPFLQDPKYFKNVKISPSATMKMMTTMPNMASSTCNSMRPMIYVSGCRRFAFSAASLMPG